MRAANDIATTVQGTSWHEAEELQAAQIIERETGVSELLEALTALTQELDWFYGHTVADITSNSVWRDAKALLAKHRTKEASQ